MLLLPNYITLRMTRDETEVRVERKTYSVAETAKVLGIGRSAAYQAVKAGEIPSIRIGRRLLVPVQALEQLLSTATPSTREMPISADPGAKSEPFQ